MIHVPQVYGEDPHLTSELAVDMVLALVMSWIREVCAVQVTGMQGNKEGEITAADGGAFMSGACCKHFAVYNNEDHPSDRQLPCRE